MKQKSIEAPQTTVYLCRHGESEGNRTGRFQGHLDTPLSAVGELQAAALAERLAGEPLDVLICSDLARARQTAEAVAARHGLQPQPDPRWREIDIGAWAGLTLAEAEARFADEFRRWSVEWQDVPRGGGESYADMQARALHALAAAVTAHAGQTICIVCHGGPIRMVAASLVGLTPVAGWRELPGCPNASLTTVVFTGGHGRLVRFADATHLGEPELAPGMLAGAERVPGGHGPGAPLVRP